MTPLQHVGIATQPNVEHVGIATQPNVSKPRSNAWEDLVSVCVGCTCTRNSRQFGLRSVVIVAFHNVYITSRD